MPHQFELGYTHIALSSLLLVAQMGLSLLLDLKLIRHIAWAGLRMIIQLSLVGMVLTQVFAWQNPWAVLGLLSAMTLVAGHTAVSRVKHRYPGIYRNAMISIFLSSWLITGYFLGAVNAPSPWYLPQYLIPLLGMVLGNGISGIALALDRLLSDMSLQQADIEARLALGATRWEAVQEIFRGALKTGMTPILNSMIAAGLVSLPGMMTGQILGGAPPQQAVNYQIVILLMISTSTAFGAFLVLYLSYLNLTASDHTLHLAPLKEHSRA